jgi:hypothetical protein
VPAAYWLKAVTLVVEHEENGIERAGTPSGACGFRPRREARAGVGPFLPDAVATPCITLRGRNIPGQ